MKAAITILVFSVGALIALGMVMLYSSSMALVNVRTHVEVGARLLVMQLIWCGLGIVACVAAVMLDYRILKKIAWLLLGAAFVMVILVLVPHIGTVHGRARRWFSFGGVSFQPSEFAKLALIIALAWYCEHFQRQMTEWKRGVLIPGLCIGLMFGFIFLEPDVGSALLLAMVSGIILLVAGIRLRYFLPPVLAVALGVGIFIYNNPMRSERIYSWLHVEETRQGKGLQAYESMNALGSGGWTGLGLGNGRQKFGFLREHTTDFIFPIIGEELGLVATLAVITAFLLIIFCGIYIAMNARETFGMLLATGITFLIGLQAFINIAVVTSVLPNKGLPLPFISYGGSNLFMMLVCVGILLSVARRARIPEPISPNPFAEEFPESQPS